MKIFGRKKIWCSKLLPNGIRERFSVIVLAADYDTAKRNYEAMGYYVK